MKLYELDVPTPSIKSIAQKHKVSVEYLNRQLQQGISIEQEHTTNKKIAAEIARDHLNEDPAYYEKLKKVEQ